MLFRSTWSTFQARGEGIRAGRRPLAALDGVTCARRAAFPHRGPQLGWRTGSARGKESSTPTAVPPPRTLIAPRRAAPTGSVDAMGTRAGIGAMLDLAYAVPKQCKGSHGHPQRGRDAVGLSSFLHHHEQQAKGHRLRWPLAFPETGPSCGLRGAPGAIRTHDLPLRRGTLYPAELRGLGARILPWRATSRRPRQGRPAGPVVN